jgi:hypothetical protein
MADGFYGVPIGIENRRAAIAQVMVPPDAGRIDTASARR